MPQPQVWPKKQEAPQHTDRAYSDGRGRKNKCRDGMPKSMGRVCTLKPIYNRDRGRNCYSHGRFGHLVQNCKR